MYYVVFEREISRRARFSGRQSGRSGVDMENGRSLYLRDEFLILPENRRRTSKLITQVQNFNFMLLGLTERTILLRDLKLWMQNADQKIILTIKTIVGILKIMNNKF